MRSASPAAALAVLSFVAMHWWPIPFTRWHGGGRRRSSGLAQHFEDFGVLRLSIFHKTQNFHLLMLKTVDDT